MSNETRVIKPFRNPKQEDRDLDSAHTDACSALDTVKTMLVREIFSDRWKCRWIGGDTHESHSEEIQSAKALIVEALKMIDQADHHIFMDKIAVQVNNDPKLSNS